MTFEAAEDAVTDVPLFAVIESLLDDAVAGGLTLRSTSYVAADEPLRECSQAFDNPTGVCSSCCV